jgi:hypothetical protein
MSLDLSDPIKRLAYRVVMANQEREEETHEEAAKEGGMNDCPQDTPVVRDARVA